MSYIAWFKDLNKDSIPVAGGKGANLGEMFNLGLPVPRGFVVTAQTYKEFIEKTNLKTKISNLLKNLDVEDNAQLQKVSQQIQDLINMTLVPVEIAKEVEESYEVLSSQRRAEEQMEGLNVFVAVRSSATAEDLPSASFAGQQATFLNVRGKGDLVKSVRACWASLFTARAIYYRVKNNFNHDTVLIAVVVQKMVNSDKSGIMFTINPANNQEDEIVIEAIYGLGEAIVSGEVSPDFYAVDKESLEVKKQEIRAKEWGLFRNIRGENEKRLIPAEYRNQSVLSENQVKELAEFGKKLEQHYGKPQDSEWAMEKDELFIVQTRPVTTFKAQIENVKSQKEEKNKILLKGETASGGVYFGRVNILVTTMTTPDMVPAMQRAGAIVTDEGGMTCFGGNTKILTTEGFMTLEQAHAELQHKKLKVFSFNPNTLKTEWKFATNPQQRKASLWKVSISQTGNSIKNTLEITPNHKMVTLENRNIVERKLQDLVRKQEMACIADFLPAHQNPHVIDEPEKAYLCGALFTDGYINNKKGYVTFIQKNIPTKERFISAVKQIFLSTYDTGLNYTRVRSTINKKIRGKEIKGSASDFISFRKKPAEDLTKIKENLADWILHLSEKSLKSFLAGVIDGDGTFNVAHKSGKVHIYASKEYLAQGVILACLRLGILPQVSKNRNCYNIQLVEELEVLLSHTRRVKGQINPKKMGNKLIAAKQVLGDIVNDLNFKGRIKPYVENNLLLDIKKMKENVLPLVKDIKIQQQIRKIIESDFRMQRLEVVDKIESNNVYNFEVEDNHTYIVFTENYTPLIVWNCHAAIVSREMGTPCIVGTEVATKVLKDGQEITVHASQGLVYEGKTQAAEQDLFVAKPSLTCGDIVTATEVKVVMDLPDMAEKAAQTGADGVGLVRLEIMIASGGIHPVEYIRRGKEADYVQLLKEGIKKIALAFARKPVWVRCSDMRSDEYRNLEGGNQEPHETDPMIGWHGIRRLLDEPAILKAEFRAVKELHDAGLRNVGVMIPFIIRTEELKKAKDLMREVGLEPVKDVDFGVMVETPASCWIIEELCKEGMSFVSFGTNDLTQLTLGIDRNNERLNDRFDEMHPAVLGELAKVIKVCKKYHVVTSICGQAGSKPEMADFLVHQGIDSISANMDAVGEIRRVVAKTERKLLLDAEREELEGKD